MHFEINKFESIPDNAFFGKRMGRFCNRFYCYIILLFIQGIIGKLILLPIFCVIFSSLLFVMAITAFFWNFVFMILLTMVTWFIYDEEIT